MISACRLSSLPVTTWSDFRFNSEVSPSHSIDRLSFDRDVSTKCSGEEDCAASTGRITLIFLPTVTGTDAQSASEHKLQNSIASWEETNQSQSLLRLCFVSLISMPSCTSADVFSVRRSHLSLPCNNCYCRKYWTKNSFHRLSIAYLTIPIERPWYLVVSLSSCAHLCIHRKTVTTWVCVRHY